MTRGATRIIVAGAMNRVSTGVVGALSAFGGSIVGGLLVLLLARLAQQPAAVPRIERSEPDRQAQLLMRVEELERSLRQLTQRPSFGAAAPAATSSAMNPSKAGAAQDPAPLVDSPVFDAAVRDVVARLDQERDAEREVQMAEIHKRQSEAWSNQLSEKLRLTESQRVRVAQIGEQFWQRLRQMAPSPNGPPVAPPEDFRKRFEAIRVETESELSKVLDSAQMNSYREFDGELRLGAFRSAPPAIMSSSEPPKLKPGI